MKLSKGILVIVVILGWSGVSFAKYLPPPGTITETVSPDTKVIAKAFPSDSAGEGRTVVFHKRGGAMVELWRLQLYSKWLRISNGGDAIALIVWRTLGCSTDLYLEFHSQEGFIRRYKVEELYRDKQIFRDLEFLTDLSGPRAVVAVSSSAPSGFTSSLDFHFVTGDRLAYDFDVRTGEIRNVRVDPLARSLDDAGQPTGRATGPGKGSNFGSSGPKPKTSRLDS